MNKHLAWTHAIIGAFCLTVAGPRWESGAQAPLWLGDWYPAVGLQITADDNVNRSFDGDGEKRDFIFAPTFEVERQTPIGETTFGYLNLAVEGRIHGKYNKLNHVAPGFVTGIRHALGGPEAPSVVVASVGLKYEFHDQDFRFGAEVNPRLEWQFRAGQALRGALYYEYDNRFASENPVYDREGHTFGFDVEASVTADAALLLGYRYRHGDVLVHQPRTDLGEEIRGRRFPLDTFRSRYDAVKIDDEDTHHVSLGLRYILSLYTSVQAGIAYEDIRAAGDSYPSMQFIFGVTHLL